MTTRGSKSRLAVARPVACLPSDRTISRGARREARPESIDPQCRRAAIEKGITMQTELARLVDR
jgi:hypothetical protein